MVTTKYCDLIQSQISQTKNMMRKRIFFLLLIVDPATAEEYENVNVEEAIESALTLFGGLNELLGYPTELVSVLSMISAAKQCWNTDFQKYRKLILDAGNEVLKIKEV